MRGRYCDNPRCESWGCALHDAVQPRTITLWSESPGMRVTIRRRWYHRFRKSPFATLRESLSVYRRHEDRTR